MATIGDYLTAKLNRFKIYLSAVELEVLLIDNNLDAETEYSAELKESIDLAIVGLIPDLLLRPDESQGDASQRWDRDAIMNYYNWLCSILGVENKLNPPGDSVQDMSYLW